MVVLQTPARILAKERLDFLLVKLPVTVDERSRLNSLEERAVTAIWPTFFARTRWIQIAGDNARMIFEERF